MSQRENTSGKKSRDAIERSTEKSATSYGTPIQRADKHSVGEWQPAGVKDSTANGTSGGFGRRAIRDENQDDQRTPQEETEAQTHVVKSRETLSEIAEEYDIGSPQMSGVEKLKQWNDIEDPRSLPVGKKLKLQAEQSAEGDASAEQFSVESFATPVEQWIEQLSTQFQLRSVLQSAENMADDIGETVSEFGDWNPFSTQQTAAQQECPATVKIPEWIREASCEIGTEEYDPGSNPEVEKYHASARRFADKFGTKEGTDEPGMSDDTFWCGSFAYWSLLQAGHAPIDWVTDEDGSRSWSQPQPGSAGDWTEFGTGGTDIDNAKFGSVVVVTREGGEHVGFIVARSDETITLLGGNQSDSVNANGVYSKDRVLYWGLPEGYDTSMLPELDESVPEEVKKKTGCDED